MEGPMALIREVALMATIPVLFISQTILPSILACINNTQFWVTFLCFLLPSYMLIVRHFRYQRVNMIKKQYGFTDDLKSYKAMTPDQSQAVLKNIAEWEFPFVFEFGWISQFFKVRAYYLAHGSFPLTCIHQRSLVPVFRASLFGIPRDRCIHHRHRSPCSPSPAFA